jgi:YD repeat-containing protein
VSRIVRTYDANGRLVEEEPFQENPVLFLADKFSAEGQSQPTAAQLEAMNTAMKSLLRGRSGTGTSYIYDEQGRTTKIHDRNFAIEKVTIISYNESGDKSEERTTIAGNSAVPVGAAFSVDENGTLIPDKRNTELTEIPDLSSEEEVRYTYQYDNYGNWTQQTVNHDSSPDKPYVRHRKLTYY